MIGYSKAAQATLERWTTACKLSTGGENEFVVNGKNYFWETSSRRHADGAITGSVYRETETRSDGRRMVRPAGAFRIDGDGNVKLAPKFLREAAVAVVIKSDNVDETVISGLQQSFNASVTA